MAQKVVIITGISSGMGKAAAKLFQSNGWIVYGGARRVERLGELAELGIHTQYLDVTDEKSNQQLVRKVLQDQGRIDVLINNAGYGEYGPLEEVSLEKARQQFEVNLFGVASITQLVLPIMRRQKAGRIINNSSIGGRIYMPMGGWYHASKHALEVYSDVLREEVSEFGIKVSVIEPGGTNTEWGKIANDNGQQTLKPNSPYQKFAKAFAAISDGDKSSFFMAPPEKIAHLMWKAATDKKPKLRYLPGLQEKAMTFAYRKLPVSWIDKVVEVMVNQLAKN